MRWIFLRDFLNFQINLENSAILLLSLQRHQHRMSFHLFRPPLISFSDIYSSVFYNSYTSFLKVIPKHFIPSDIIVNRIVSLVLFLDCSLTVYGSTTDIGILIMYSISLLISFPSYNSIFLIPPDFLYI